MDGPGRTSRVPLPRGGYLTVKPDRMLVPDGWMIEGRAPDGWWSEALRGNFRDAGLNVGDDSSTWPRLSG